jgi:hypothetical protein
MTTDSRKDPFLNAAEKEGIDPEEVRRILWAVLAPPTRDDLSEVLGKFARVLTAAGDQWPGVLLDLNIETWPSISRKLGSIAQTLVFPKTPMEARFFGKSGQGGHRQRNALYFAILALPDETSAYADSCYLLVAHVFVAHHKVLKTPAKTVLPGCKLVKGDTSLEAYEAYSWEEQWRALTISPKNCCMALREYFAGETWAKAVVPEYPLGDRPSQFAKYGGLIFEGQLIENGKAKARLQELQEYVLRYLAQAHGFKVRRRGHGKAPGSGADSSKTSTEREAKAEAAYRHDICPGEDELEGDENEPSLGNIESDGDPQSRETTKRGRVTRKPKGTAKPRKRAGNSGGVGSNQAIRNSKFFPFATDRLSLSTLATIDIDGRRRAEAILDELKTTFGCLKTANNHDEAEEALKSEVELFLFLLVMLWSNSDIERTHALRVYLSETCRDRIALAILMSPGTAGSSAQIRIHVEYPPDAPRRERLLPYDRDRTEFVTLPDEAKLGPLLWDYLIALDGASVVSSRTNAIEVFRQPIEHYYKEIPRALERLAEGQLSSLALSSALFGEIMNWSHKDISAATIITGTLHKKARVQMFYAVRRMTFLHEIYVGTVRYVRKAICLAKSADFGSESKPNGLSSLLQLQRRTSPHTPFIPTSEETKYVGINACPHDEAMRQAVQELIAKVEDAWAKSPSTNWIEAHNLYTFYVVWFFGFVTGARPTERPILRVSEINQSNLSGRLQDKGADKARLVWINGDLFEQLELNEAYVDTTRLASCTSYPCWFLNETGAPKPASEEICEPILHRVLPGFPTNIHRRWMFNALLDSGCPYVAEWAGHFLTGNRLVGRGATASPTVVGQTILKYVEPIISYLGFRPIRVKL